MKKIIIILFILLYFTLPAQCNPILVKILSEVYLDDNDDWSIELYDYSGTGFPSLDGCYLKSITDMAYFNSGIFIPADSTIVVSNTDMQTDLTINRDNDVLLMRGNFYDGIAWGNNPYSRVDGPNQGQSLVRVKVYLSSNPAIGPSFFLAKENEPSLGYNPFEAQTFGGIQGCVSDGGGMPISGAYVSIFPVDHESSTVVTDVNGYFEILDIYGLNYDLSVSLSGYASIDTTITVEPDSITFVEIFPIYDIAPTPHYINYSISNYPNPFYEETTIHYSLPHLAAGTITIFNIKGQKIKEIQVSHLESSVSWTGIDEQHNQVPSGVYFYRLESENVTLASGKMLYLK